MRAFRPPCGPEPNGETSIATLRRMVTDMDFNVTEEKLSVDATILRLPGVGIADSRTTAFRTIRSRAMAKGDR